MGIHVNTICPGFYRTNLEGGSDDPDFAQSVREFVPMGKIAELEDINGTAIYLASEASDRQVPGKPRPVGGELHYMCGQMIVIDGGIVAK